MQQANRSRVYPPAQPQLIIPTKPMLVPPLPDGGDPPCELEQEWRERSQVIDPVSPLQPHPRLDPVGVPSFPPSCEVDDHDPGVEVAGLAWPGGEGPREGRVGPEGRGEVGGEVGPAVLGCGDDGAVGEGCGCEVVDVVDEDEVGVEVDEAWWGAGRGEDVGETDAGVVERAVECGAEGRGDEVGDGGRVEGVDGEGEGGEGGGEGGGQRGDVVVVVGGGGGGGGWRMWF